jgi:hypothetical protein
MDEVGRVRVAGLERPQEVDVDICNELTAGGDPGEVQRAGRRVVERSDAAMNLYQR